MIDILKRIFIGVAFGMSIFFLNSSFGYALTYDLDFITEKSVFNSSKLVSIHIGSNASSSSPTTSSNVNFDSSFNNTGGYRYAVFPISSITYNTTGISGDNSIFVLLDYDFTIQLITTSSTSSFCEYQNNFIICPILKDTPYTGIRFSLNKASTSINSTIYLSLDSKTLFYNSYLAIFASNSSQTLIETKKITDTTDNSGNGNTFDNSGVSSNNTKEESLTDGADDLFDNFDVDLSSNSNAFQFIFQLLTRFVQANAKIFGVILSILSFGFIKLVLGR